MIRKLAVLTLIAAFAFATGPSLACTGISLKAKDGAAVRGRTLEFGFPMQSNVLIVPPGQEFSGTLPDGGKGLTYTSKYAVVGANALNLPLILDGLNDQGLSVGLFYFPGYASYTPVTSENAKRAIAPHEFGLWVLANFATVDEVKELRKSGYNPWEYYRSNRELKGVIDAIASGVFSPEEPRLFQPIIDSLLNGGDQYMLLADFAWAPELRATAAGPERPELAWLAGFGVRYQALTWGSVELGVRAREKDAENLVAMLRFNAVWDY